MKTILRNSLILLLFVFCTVIQAQEDNYNSGTEYVLEDITVSGNTSFNAQTIVAYSGLRKGSKIFIPGEAISNAIKKLWKSNLFSDIEVFLTKTEGDKAYIELKIADLPELNDLKVRGVKKSKVSEIVDENKLKKGAKVTENLITTTKNYLASKYRKEGFLNTKVNIATSEVNDSIDKSRVNMVLAIDKGKKVKVNKINITGNTAIKATKLRRAMKNTKQKNITNLFKRSKYIEADYKDDLKSLIDKYKENGYRDARILSDTLIVDDNSNITLNIDLEEGEKYTFGDISFIGNTVFSDEQLKRQLRIEKGDTYNGVALEKRIADNSKPDANDLTNLYQDSGYLFSTINPVETNAKDNVIDMEIRITEGKPVYFNEVSVVGNTKTNDHVIYRELRTRPGQLYSKTNVVRTVRELSQLGYFDAQQITPNFKNADPEAGTIDMEYAVVETGTSQIELQGGYGGGGFIGTLGLSFNNFSIKDIFKKDAYKPLPMGDGQKLSLRLQASRFNRIYSFSFSEPWLGGKKPVNFSTSLSYTQQFRLNNSGDVDKNQRFNIAGISIGLAKRLNKPDDNFTLSQALSFQNYDLKNYNRADLFSFSNGYSNNLAYTIGLSRNNTFNDPIFPLGGSNFSITAKFTFPYSLFNGVDYKALKQELDANQAIADQYPINTTTDPFEIALRNTAQQRIGDIDQERYKWLEFYKIKFKGEWYTRLFDKLVLRPSVEFAFLGAYNQDRGLIPFERYRLGGTGLGNFNLAGTENVALRGYEDNSIQAIDENGRIASNGGTIYNKFSLELRYPITLKQTAKIYALGFLEAGGLYNNFRSYDPFKVQRSAGLGVRIFMPAFGLLGIDFGHGFDPVPGATTKSGWQTHFIIGQQF